MAADNLIERLAGPSELVSSVGADLEAVGPRSLAPDKAHFLQGVRRGLKKLGTTSIGQGRPPGAHRADQLTWPAAPIDAALTPSSSQLGARASPRHGRGVRTFDNLQKPLPPQPLILPSGKGPEDSPQSTPKQTGDMSRATPAASRTSTMDSTTSILQADANGSQSSFVSSVREGEGESNESTTARSMATPASSGPSPAIGRPRSGGGPNGGGTPPTSSTHLSGLMCNVHRTTGREPHPLVGATTTILGDKLYVFGGRLLSRTRPILTADLYELDLIHRHWTKIETNGDIPPPRYFHSMCALGDTKLVCYGGMSPAAPSGTQLPQGAPQNGQDAQPEVVVMSDIYIYDVPRRTWSFILTADAPQGRYAHCATILPSTATFSSANAPMSAIQHNPSSGNPNQGTIGVNIDGTGGAEMVVVGGQDSANHYIEQISVFNLRSLKWTSTLPLGKSCGAYRSVVAPIPCAVSSRIGKTSPIRSDNATTATTGISQEAKEPGCSMLIYSNYNFLDVKLELQVRAADGTLTEKPMAGSYTPPGLRFPNGGVIDTNFVVSGTYLTSSKQEYALWALDLKTLTWGRIDAGGSVFNQGSWNRGVLWNRRNTFVILGNRKRSLVEDYNHRRLNFNHICMVELEAFGFYDNPRRVSPMSGYVSASSPYPSPTAFPGRLGSWAAGGRTPSKAAEELGNVALNLRELADMDILSVGGERIPVNSRILARRWGPYFVQLLREGTAAGPDGNDAATLRPSVFSHNASRNSSITITPGFTGNSIVSPGRATTLNESNPDTDLLSPFGGSPMTAAAASQEKKNIKNLLSPPTPDTLPSGSRPRTLYLPHTYLTLQSLLYFLYTSALPPPSSTLCTPQILCSLLQLARPYRIDGLLEAVVERLHGVLDSRNAAAVFNAAAMAAGGGRGVGGWVLPNGESFADPSASSTNASSTSAAQSDRDLVARNREELRINTAVGKFGSGSRGRAGSGGETEDSDGDGDGDGSAVSSTASSSAFDSESDAGSGAVSREGESKRRRDQSRGGEMWNGDISTVIGLQKRGLRGLMEGRRLRERGGSLTREGQSNATSTGVRVGLGIA